MKKKNEENRHAESFEESLEVLFGRESDLTDEELDEELKACGIDPVELQADVHKQIFDHANYNYRTLDREVPENLERALKALRPPSAADKATAVVSSAETLVGNFLETVKAKSSEILSSVSPSDGQQPQFAFRNKKDLSAADKALLQSEQDDVDSAED